MTTLIFGYITYLFGYITYILCDYTTNMPQFQELLCLPFPTRAMNSSVKTCDNVNYPNQMRCPMKLTILPSSRAGKWAVWPVIGSLLVMLLLFLLAEKLNLLPDGVVIVLGAASQLVPIAAFIIALFAWFKSKDHALLLILAAVTGLAVLTGIVATMISELT